MIGKQNKLDIAKKDINLAYAKHILTIVLKFILNDTFTATEGSKDNQFL